MRFVVVVAVLVGAAAAVAPVGDEPAVAGPGEAALLVLGDSLCVGARYHEGGLTERLEGAGWDPVFVCDSGEPLSWGIAEVDAMESVPSVVVVALGTNPRADDRGFLPQVAELRTALVDRGAERILWVDYADRDGEYRAKTRLLHRFAEHHGDEIVRWAAVVTSRPEWFRSDGLHYRPEGVVAWSAAIAAALTAPGVDASTRDAVRELSHAVAAGLRAAVTHGRLAHVR